MDILFCILLFIGCAMLFSLLTRKWGYRIGVGMARKRLKDLGLEKPKKEVTD